MVNAETDLLLTYIFVVIVLIINKVELVTSIMDVGNIQKITAAQFGSRYKSKKDCFQFLTVEVGAFLPSYHTLSIYFLKGEYP